MKTVTVHYSCRTCRLYVEHVLPVAEGVEQFHVNLDAFQQCDECANQQRELFAVIRYGPR